MASCSLISSFLLFVTICYSKIQEIQFSEKEGNMLFDFMKHLQIKRSIIVGNKISSTVNLSSFKKMFTSSETFSAIQTAKETFPSYFSNVTVEPKTMLVYKPLKNVENIKQYFSYLHKVSP